MLPAGRRHSPPSAPAADPAVVALALGGRRQGTGWIARCPSHADRSPSLSVGAGADGRLLVHCFAGCAPADVLAAIRALDLASSTSLPGSPPDPSERRRDTEARIARAQAVWGDASPIASHDLADCYLIGRSLPERRPPSLRFHPAAHHTTGAIIPSLVAAACRWPDRCPVAVQLTALDPSTACKASLKPQRWTLGHLSGAAVRLSAWQEGREILVTEGVEDGLAVLAAVPGAAVWAALGVANVPSIALPPGAPVILALDGDDAGRRSVAFAARSLTERGHRVRVADMGDGFDPLDRLLAEAVP